MTILVAAEPRIALALEPPAGSPSQPLTLAGLQVSPCPSPLTAIASWYDVFQVDSPPESPLLMMSAVTHTRVAYSDGCHQVLPWVLPHVSMMP